MQPCFLKKPSENSGKHRDWASISSTRNSEVWIMEIVNLKPELKKPEPLLSLAFGVVFMFVFSFVFVFVIVFAFVPIVVFMFI